MRFCNPAVISILIVASSCWGLSAQTPPVLDGRDGRQLLLENFRPQAALKVRHSSLKGAKFPAIDIHSHLKVRLKHSPEQLDAFVQVMDRQGITPSRHQTQNRRPEI